MKIESIGNDYYSFPYCVLTSFDGRKNLKAAETNILRL